MLKQNLHGFVKDMSLKTNIQEEVIEKMKKLDFPLQYTFNTIFNRQLNNY